MSEETKDYSSNAFMENFPTKVDEVSINNGKEPLLFTLILVYMAKYVLKEIVANKTIDECIEEANNLDFFKNINKYLEGINISISMKLVNVIHWEFEFSIVDTARNEVLEDISSLSDSQKSAIEFALKTYGGECA